MWLLLAWPTPAHACTIVSPTELVLDPSLQDEEPPAPPEVLDVEIQRGRGPRGVVVRVSTSCDDLGFIRLNLARPQGDPDSEATVGYQLEKVEGDLPSGLSLPLLWDNPWLGPELTLGWIDEAENRQDPFDFTLALIPVDLAGNEGEPALVTLSHDGKREGGCSHAPGASLSWAGLLVLAALARLGCARSPSAPRRGGR